MARAPKKVLTEGARPTLALADPSLLPDEDPAAYQALLEEMVEEFSPQSPYQHRLVLNLTDIEWELERHRRLMATLVAMEFRDQASIASRSPSRHSNREAYQAEQTKPDLGSELQSSDPQRRHVAEGRLVSLKLTRAELTASSYDIMFERVRWHESRIADLERRRRALLADYQGLRDRQTAKRSIPDAEVIE